MPFPIAIREDASAILGISQATNSAEPGEVRPWDEVLQFNQPNFLEYGNYVGRVRPPHGCGMSVGISYRLKLAHDRRCAQDRAIAANSKEKRRRELVDGLDLAVDPSSRRREQRRRLCGNGHPANGRHQSSRERELTASDSTADKQAAMPPPPPPVKKVRFASDPAWTDPADLGLNSSAFAGTDLFPRNGHRSGRDASGGGGDGASRPPASRSIRRHATQPFTEELWKAEDNSGGRYDDYGLASQSSTPPRMGVLRGFRLGKRSHDADLPWEDSESSDLDGVDDSDSQKKRTKLLSDGGGSESEKTARDFD